MAITAGDWVVGTIFLLQSLFGTLGNFSLLSNYLFHHFSGYKLRSTDLIVKNLIVSNCLVLFSSAIRYTLESFRWYYAHNDLSCQLFHYVLRVGRGLSISTTCLLSIAQAITISPRSSRWAQLKGKISKLVIPSLTLCWIVAMLANVIHLMFIRRTLSFKNISHRKSFGYCSSVRHDKNLESVFITLLSFPDAVCLALMLWASGSMVFILHRHQQRVQHLHRNSDSSKPSPEARATKTILLLVSTFICFYSLSSICHVLVALFQNPSVLLVKITAVFTAAFSTVSPFLLISRDTNLDFDWRHSRKCPNSK
ncbi:vomeronasal type-1 receptor 4-like [Erinaceus europaeus]|uniref:Vomeronasal type-1 receptor n=1 Tax=Erinaceus europaeus TaxID=9365 RepID=A0A1S2Z9V9_ERIEU|nr:vomeronasal type-1 receptor 4-like [Erinaceus europaeus]